MILFIGRNRFQLVGGNLSGIITLEIPEAVIRDIDIVSKDGLYTLIKQWVKQYTIAAGQLVLVLSEETYFDKQFSTHEHPEVETDVLKFFDMVPYESIWTKVYSVPTGKRAIAINKAWYEAISQGFSLQGFQIKSMIPAFTLGQLSGASALDAKLVDHIMKNYDALARQSLLDATELTPAMQREQESKPSGTAKPRSNLPLYLGVFGVLMVVLVITVVMQLQ